MTSRSDREHAVGVLTAPSKGLDSLGRAGAMAKTTFWNTRINPVGAPGPSPAWPERSEEDTLEKDPEHAGGDDGHENRHIEVEATLTVK